MRRSARVFWGTAALVALAVTALAPVALPYEALGLDAEADRRRAWLLTVFTMGVMGLLFGSASLLAGPRQPTVRDVAEAGGVAQAKENLRRAAQGEGAGYARNFALWCVAAGGLLLICYFGLWLALR